MRPIRDGNAWLCKYIYLISFMRGRLGQPANIIAELSHGGIRTYSINELITLPSHMREIASVECSTDL